MVCCIASDGDGLVMIPPQLLLGIYLIAESTTETFWAYAPCTCARIEITTVLTSAVREHLWTTCDYRRKSKDSVD